MTTPTEKKLFLPAAPTLAELANLRWSKHKTLKQAKNVWATLLYVLHACYIQQVSDPKSYRYLSAITLSKMSGSCHQWSTLKELLIRNDYLISDNTYFFGVKTKCMGYRLGEKFKGVAFAPSAEPVKYRKPVLAGDEEKVIVANLSIDKDKARAICLEQAELRGWDSTVTDWQLWIVENFSNEFKKGVTDRLFGNANQIPSQARSALLLDGKETAEVDIVSSQPTFLASIYPTESEEKARYCELVESGRLYERFQELTGDPCRKSQKTNFLAVIYGGTLPKFQPTKNALKSEFPELAKEIAALAKLHGKDYLAHHLQKVEASVILAACAKYSGCSVHDGLRCRVEDAPEVAAWVENKIKGLVGVNAKTTISK